MKFSLSDLTTSKTVDRAEDSKVQYYKPVFAKLPTFTFILCAFDSLGQTGPGAKSVLKDIFTMLHATTPSRFASSSVKTTPTCNDNISEQQISSPIVFQRSVVLARAIGAQLTAMSSDHFPFSDVEDSILGSVGESTAHALLQMAVELAASLDLTVEGNIDTTFIPLANADRVPLQPFPPLLQPSSNGTSSLPSSSNPSFPQFTPSLSSPRAGVGERYRCGRLILY